MLEWSPSKKQEAFCMLPDSIKEGFYGGAASGGKSEVLLMLPLVRKFYQAPRFKGLLLRRTFPELEKSLIYRTESDGFYKGCGGEYNRAQHRWRFPSGAILDFGYVEYEQDVRKYDTAEYNYIGFDELTSFTEFQYLYIAMSRCRSNDENLPAIIRSASNPGNIGHGWVRKRFVEPNSAGNVLIKDTKTGLKRIFIKALVTDNPHIADRDAYVASLSILPEAERKAKLDGDWWTFSGQVFDDFRTAPFPDEPANARHVIEPFEIPSYWPQVLAVDWGFAAMTVAEFAAASPDKRCIVNEEYTCKQTKISTWATEIGRRAEGRNIVDVVLDPSAWQHRGDEKTIAAQFKEYSGLNPRPADNDRLGGKFLLQEYLRFRPKPPRKIVVGIADMEYATHLLRWKGVEAYHKYLADFQPEEAETNLPRLQIFNTCSELIKCIPLCVYKGNDSQGMPSEDVAEFDGDDPYDTVRYLLKAVDRFYTGSAQVAARVLKREEITQEFARTGDWNALYNKARVLDRAEKRTKLPLRRFRRFRRVA